MSTTPDRILPYLRKVLPKISIVDQHIPMLDYFVLAGKDLSKQEAWRHFMKLFRVYLQEVGIDKDDGTSQLWAFLDGHSLGTIYFDPRSETYVLYEASQHLAGTSHPLPILIQTRKREEQ
jgi:hypothetical protein